MTENETELRGVSFRVGDVRYRRSEQGGWELLIPDLESDSVVTKQLKSKSQKAAKWLAIAENNRLQEALVQRGLSFEEASQKVIRGKAKTIKHASLKRLQIVVGHFSRLLKAKGLDSCAVDELEWEVFLEYQKFRLEEGAKSQTINTEITSISTILKEAESQGIISKNPLSYSTKKVGGKIALLKEDVDHGYLTKNQKRHLLKGLRKKHLGMFLIALLMMEEGLPFDILSQLKTSDIKLIDQKLLMITQSGRRLEYELSKVSLAGFRETRRRIKKRHPDKSILQNGKRWVNDRAMINEVKRCLKNRGIVPEFPVNLECLQSTYVVKALKKGVPTKEISKRTGPKLIDSIVFHASRIGGNS